MNFIKNVWVKILALFGIKTMTTDQEYTDNQLYESNYESTRRINFNSIFSNKISNYVCSESSVSIEETDKRSLLLSNTIQLIDKDKKKIVNRMLGTGGIVIVPYVYKNEILYKLVPQFRLSINEKQGNKITNATLLADVKTIKDGYTTKTYYRWQNEEVKGTSLYITQKYTDENGATILKPEVYADVIDRVIITNVDRCLFGYGKSPIDNRRNHNDYGVPITYGCSATINEIYECLDQIRSEFKTKEAFIGVDYTMFKTNGNGEVELPSNHLYRKFNSDKDNFWEVFDPAIRESSYYARLQELYERLEKEIGTSKGILSTPETVNATATEIRKAMYDTFTIVEQTREQFERCIEDFIYACQVLANYYNLTPMSEVEVKYDWSYDLLENTQETFNQLVQGKNLGVVDEVELRQFIIPSETIQQAEEKIQEIKEKNPSVNDLLGLSGGEE